MKHGQHMMPGGKPMKDKDMKMPPAPRVVKVVTKKK